MSLCHECGETVATIDVYCPYCGISIKSSEADATFDDSLASTIIVGRPEAPAISGPESRVENVGASPDEVAAEVPFESALTEKQSGSPDESAIGDASVESPAPENKEFDRVFGSGPSTISDEMRETIEEEPDPVTEPDVAGLGMTPAEPAAEADSRDLATAGGPVVGEEEAVESVEFSEIGIEPDLPDAAPLTAEEIFSDSALGSDVAADIGLPDSAGEDPGQDLSPPNAFAATGRQLTDDPAAAPGTELTQIESGDPGIEAVGNFEEIMSGKASSALAGEPADAPLEVHPAIAADADRSDASAAADLSTADSAESEGFGHSITKPETELESKDSIPGASEFDSVRIIESPSEKIDEPEPGIEPQFRTLADENAPGGASAGEPFEGPENSAADGHSSRAYTTPNIGVGDTDGKKSKLKPLGEGIVLNGRYEIVRKIGGGGMGAVYLASDKNLGGVLRAVKEMVQSYIEEQQQEKAIADFKRESLLLTTLEHPAIPTIYDYFYDEKEARFYLVMKYINGGDLASRLRAAPDGRIDEKTVVDWACQMADVLDYLHKREPPIVYRDLKPANIMMDGNTGRVMLIDFGIARWINKEEKGVTAVGTMGYAPPELFSGNVEPRSDIYSLGSTMFHLLTGADPQSNPLLIFDFQKHARPRQINPQLSDQIERILMQAVEYNASKRIPSAAEMRRELEEHLQNLQANRVTFGVKEAPAIIGLADENVFCGFCGQNIVASDMFCAFCGAKQPIAQKGVHREIYASPRLTASLMVIGTNDLESPVFTIEKDDNLVGRRDPMSNIFPEVDLSKFDPQTKISRRHARIWREGGNFMVEDLGSSNGTILLPMATESFRLTPSQPHVLTSGDKLKLGDTTLHFVLG